MAKIEFKSASTDNWAEYSARKGEDAAKKLAQLLSQEHSDWEYRVVGDDGQQVWPEQAKEGGTCQADTGQRK